MGVCDIGEVSLGPSGTNTLFLLNDVAGDWGSSIIVGLLPGQANGALGDVTNAQVDGWLCRTVRTC